MHCMLASKQHYLILFCLYELIICGNVHTISESILSEKIGLLKFLIQSSKIDLFITVTKLKPKTIFSLKL